MRKSTIKGISAFVGLCLIGTGLMACGSKPAASTSPSPSASAKASASPSASPAASKAPSATPAASKAPSASPAASPAASKAPSASPAASAAASPAAAASKNLALGKTATASNSNSKAQPGNALDGNLETVWRCNGPSDSNTFIEYTVDLGAATSFNKVALMKLYNPQKYKAGSGKIQYSDDGKTWKDAAKIDKWEDNVTVTFPEVKAKFVRLYADKAGVDDNTIGFGEFELYLAK